MSIVRIDNLDDPRVAPYRNLKDRDLAAEGGLFIAEGEQLVRRLIASRFETVSVLLAEHRAGEMAPIVPAGVPVYVGPRDVINGVLGYKFHSGVMAVGRRGATPTIDSVLRTGDDETAARGKPVTLVVCPELANTENLGSLIRVAAGFGADAMILGPRSCDPFFRQSVRVSMGSVFSLPIIQSHDLLRDLDGLKRAHGVELLASVVGDPSAEPLERSRRTGRIAILFGNEAQGLRPEEIDACDRRVTIPMKLGTDSLNVTIAAALFLYHYTREQECG